jgi:hypothetical protein
VAMQGQWVGDINNHLDIPSDFICHLSCTCESCSPLYNCLKIPSWEVRGPRQGISTRQHEFLVEWPLDYSPPFKFPWQWEKEKGWWEIRVWNVIFICKWGPGFPFLFHLCYSQASDVVA